MLDEIAKQLKNFRAIKMKRVFNKINKFWLLDIFHLIQAIPGVKIK